MIYGLCGAVNLKLDDQTLSSLCSSTSVDSSLEIRIATVKNLCMCPECLSYNKLTRKQILVTQKLIAKCVIKFMTDR